MDKHTFQVAITHVLENDPGNNMVPIIQDLGYSPVAIAYLESELEVLHVPEKKREIQKAADIPELKPMSAKLNALFVERFKLSNSFHDVTTDMERSDISIRIQNIQDDIKHCMLAMDHLKLHGEVLPDKNAIVLPENPFELVKKLEYNRQSISRAKRNLEKLKKEQKNTNRQTAGLEKLLEYERHIKAAIAAAAI